jgi:anti-anti-sigma regulatory factor
MTNPAPSLLVAIANHSAIVKVNGRANFTTSVSFKRLIHELTERGYRHFVLDLSDCVTMDSTFLGVLAGTALKLTEPSSHSPGSNSAPAAEARPALRLVNPNQRVADLLDNLGVSELFPTVQCDGATVPADHLTPAKEVQPSREELSATCLEAHQVLMDVNPENIPRFKDVAQFLAEDMKKAPPRGE